MHFAGIGGNNVRRNADMRSRAMPFRIVEIETADLARYKIGDGIEVDKTVHVVMRSPQIHGKFPVDKRPYIIIAAERETESFLVFEFRMQLHGKTEIAVTRQWFVTKTPAVKRKKVIIDEFIHAVTVRNKVEAERIVDDNVCHGIIGIVIRTGEFSRSALVRYQTAPRPPWLIGIGG